MQLIQLYEIGDLHLLPVRKGYKTQYMYVQYCFLQNLYRAFKFDPL